MYRQPIDTGRRPSNDPTICSALINKVSFKSLKRNNKSQQLQHDKAKKQRTEPVNSGDGKDKSPRDGKRLRDNDDSIKKILRSIKKVTSMLPIAVQMNDTFEEGKRDCETCRLDKETYKKVLETIKVVEILVDGVVEKEQTELMATEYDLDEENCGGDNVPNKEQKQGECVVSLELEIFCEKSVEHNLKCVLFNLQKAIGDTIVQVCFVKARKLGKDERYRKFDISMDDLKLLKFDYSSLIDKIIQLFKKPLAKKKTTSADICLACLKEDLAELTKRLADILKTGRNVKVVMRNDYERKDQCCSRDYPHIHAEALGKPIVLKYSVPFQVVEPKARILPTPSVSTMKIGTGVNDFPPIDEEDWPRKTPRTIQPYDEWPEGFPLIPDLSQLSEKKDDYGSMTLQEEPKDTESFSFTKEQSNKKGSIASRDNEPSQPRSTSENPSMTTKEEAKDTTSSYLTKELSSKTDSIASRDNEPNQSRSTSKVLSNEPIKPNYTSSKPIQPEVLSKMESIEPNQKSNFPKIYSKELKNEKYVSESSVSLKKEPSPVKDGASNAGLYDKISQGRSSEDDYSIKEPVLTKDISKSLDSLIRDNYNKNIARKKSNEPSKTQQREVSSSSSSEYSTLESTTFTQTPSKESACRDNKVVPNKTSHDTSKSQDTSNKTTQTDLKEDKEKRKIGEKLNKEDKELEIKSLDKSETDKKDSDSSSFSNTSLEREINENEKKLKKVSFYETNKNKKVYFTLDIDTNKDIYLNNEDLQRKHGFSIPEFTATHTTPASQKTQLSKHITHKNKLVEELLNTLGRENLVLISPPAKCCPDANHSVNSDSLSHLPISASLHSLPLNRDDLIYIANAVKKNMEIMLIPVDELPVKEYELENTNDEMNEDKTKWERAIAGSTYTSDQQQEEINDTQRRQSTVKQGIVNRENLYQLTPISEEENSLENCRQLDPILRPSTSYIEEQRKMLQKKKQEESIKSYKNMEIRYFTVEFSKNNQDNLPKSTSKISICTMISSSNTNLNNKVDGEKVVSEPQGHISIDSFHSCSSFTPININDDKIDELMIKPNSEVKNAIGELAIKPNSEVKNAIDEMIMLNVIYICNPKVEDQNNMHLWTPFKKSSNISHDDSGSLQQCKCKKVISPLLNKNTAEINCESQKTQLFKSKPKAQGLRNKSYTVFNKFTYNFHSDIYNNNSANSKYNLQKVVKNKSYTVVKNSLNLFNDKGTKQLNKFKRIDSNLIIQKKPQNTTYTLAKFNMSNLGNRIKLQNENIRDMSLLTTESIEFDQFTKFNNSEISKIGYSFSESYATNICNNFFMEHNPKQKRQFNIIRESGQQKKCCSKDIANFNLKSMENVNKNYKKNFVLQNIPQYLNTSKKTDNLTFQRSFGCKNNWSKLYLSNSKVKKNIEENRISNSPKVSVLKNFGELKRNPCIPKVLWNSCSIKIIKITKQKLHFLKLLPVLAQCEIPNLKIKSNSRHYIANEFTATRLRNGEIVFILEMENIQSTQNDKSFFKSDSMFKRGYIKVNSSKQTEIRSSNKKIPININKPVSITKSDHSFKVISRQNSYVIAKGSRSCTSLTRNGLTKSTNFSNRLKECYLVDQDFNPLCLYTKTGRPLTDNNGRPLRNMNGELLIICDEDGIPICDAENNPIFDAFGCPLLDSGFNPMRPPRTQIFKSLTEPSGSPMVLYDNEGKPLTSESGTMLVDASGKGLIRFGCTGYPISDFNGRPVFCANGRHFAGLQ